MEFAKDLLFNMTILTSFIAISNQVFREKIATKSSPLSLKIANGVFGGLLGCLLIIFSLEVVPQTYLDLRILPIIILFVYANYVSAVVACLIIGLFRILYMGLTISSIISFFAIALIGLFCWFISKIRTSRTIKWILSTLAAFLIMGCLYVYLIRNLSLLEDLLPAYCIGFAVSSFLTYLLMENIRKFNKTIEETEFYAQKDSLTGLNNVRQFENLFCKAANEAVQERKNISFLFLDIDFFKKVNDTYGHLDGNAVLVELSELLNRNCRGMDIISRNGGEEFSVILPDCSLPQAVEAAERIRKAVEQHDFPLSSGKTINITISIGVSSYPEDTDNPLKLIESADIALYRAKESGRNRVSTQKM